MFTGVAEGKRAGLGFMGQWGGRGSRGGRPGVDGRVEQVGRGRESKGGIRMWRRGQGEGKTLDTGRSCGLKENRARAGDDGVHVGHCNQSAWSETVWPRDPAVECVDQTA